MTNIRKFMAVSAFGLTALFAKDAAVARNHKPHPGSIVAIGGDEDKTRNMVVLKSLLAEAKGKNSNVVVVTTASTEPERRKSDYTKAFKTLGVTKLTFIYIDDREQAFDSRIHSKLKNANVVFFSGGDQLRLTSLLGGTPFLQEVRQMNQKGTVVGGTSAGGAVLSDLMVYDGSSELAVEKGEVLLTSGFRFVDRVAFDTHFMNRDRLPRLFNIVASNPEILGIGMDEDTGVIFHRGGDVLEVVGKGNVTVVDGSRIRSDYHLVERGKVASYNNIAIHSLSAGDRFNIRMKEQLPYPAAAAPEARSLKTP